MARRIFLAIVCVCLLAGCGHSSLSSSTPTTSSNAAPSSTGAAATASAAAAGCGTYCQQAGDSAGNGPPGYPCPKAGCQQCPPKNCVTLESSGATATNGVATVKLSCNLSTACHGAFLICLPLFTCWAGPTQSGGGGRLAGSDFVVPPKTTSEVGVALTALGQQVASGPHGFSATVFVDLLDYGSVLGSVLNTTNSETGNFSLTSTDPPTFPAGATASCGGLLFVGPNTSCPFAENVANAYLNSNGSTVSAVSPSTGQTYTMQCTGESPHVCRGGTNAVVEFYR